MEIEQIKTALHGADPQFVDQVRVAALTEQERRANLAAIPEQIEQLAKVYRDGGGDEQALTDALDA